jgi:streptogramin lyase
MAFASGIRSLRIVPLLAFASWIAVPTALASGGVGDLYVTSDASNIVRAYDGTSGAFLGVHATSVNAIGELGIHFGTLNGRFLVGSFGGGVDEFNAVSGAYIKTYSPGGGWQWAGIYAPTGNVYIGSFYGNDVSEYDVNTGAFIRIVSYVQSPADMRFGPNGNLYICSFNGGFVYEVHPITGAAINQWSMPAGAQPNDIAFLPNGEILVTAMRTNVVYRYSPAMVLLGSFTGTGWGNPHGIEIGPVDGNIYVVDGISSQVHVFDPVTFNEIDTAFLSPDPGEKIVDLEFRADDRIVPTLPTTWGRIKNLFN